MHISLSTLRQSLRLAEDLAELDEPGAFPETALPALGGLVGCDVITYNEIGPAPGEVHAVDYPSGVISSAGLESFASHVHEHPLVNHYRDTGDDRPAKISDFLSRPRFHALGLYADFFRHIPVEHQIGVSLPAPGRKVVGLAFNRARGDFTETERDLLILLRDHMATALLRAYRRQRARQALTAGTSPAAGIPADPAAREPIALTEREAQILQLVALGRTNIAVARALGVSPRTVAKHLEHIYRKLDVTSRASAVFQATSVLQPTDED
jgi:DNA-binding CsgD family transcriptional regulator